jgi:hypothetical protein
MPRDDATLLDILRAARLAVAFMGDLNKPAFLNDLKTQSAILHQLLVLGEEDKNFKRTFSPAPPGTTPSAREPLAQLAAKAAAKAAKRRRSRGCLPLTTSTAFSITPTGCITS